MDYFHFFFVLLFLKIVLIAYWHNIKKLKFLIIEYLLQKFKLI